MPPLRDASGAVASRFIVFRTRVSFFGKEDPSLFQDKLTPEIPSILLWALKGLRRVQENRRVAEPQCSVEERQTLARNASPVLAFVQDHLSMEDPNSTTPKDELYDAWQDYAVSNNLPTMPKDVFMNKLYPATGDRAKECKITINKHRVPGVRGLKFISKPHPRHLGKDKDDDIDFTSTRGIWRRSFHSRRHSIKNKVKTNTTKKDPSSRRRNENQWSLSPPRHHMDISNGHVLVCGDAHVGVRTFKPTTAWRALVKFIVDYRSTLKAVIHNGDLLDLAASSRHPRVLWTPVVSVKEKIEHAQELLHQGCQRRLDFGQKPTV